MSHTAQSLPLNLDQLPSNSTGQWLLVVDGHHDLCRSVDERITNSSAQEVGSKALQLTSRPKEIPVNEQLLFVLPTPVRLGKLPWGFPLDAAAYIQYTSHDRQPYIGDTYGYEVTRGQARDPAGHIALAGLAVVRYMAPHAEAKWFQEITGTHYAVYVKARGEKDELPRIL